MTLRFASRILVALLFLAPALRSTLAGTDAGLQSDSSASTAADQWTIHVNYVFGYKHLDARWAPAQHHLEFGIVDADAGKKTWPVNICFQLLLSYAPAVPRGVDADFSGTYEFNIGVRKVFRLEEEIQPHIAAGMGILGGATTTHLGDGTYVQEENNSGAGYWASAGFFWLFSDSFLTGFSIRYSRATSSLFNDRTDVGGVYLLFNFGWYL